MAQFINAIVVQKNNSVYISAGGITVQKSGGSEILVGLGLSTVVPTPEANAWPDADYWAVPVGQGALTSINYIPYNANDPVTSIKPVPQSFAVCRIYNQNRSDYWYIVGTLAQYITADGGAALPTTITTLLAPYQKMCEFDANGKYFAVLGLPDVNFGLHYFPYGYFNNASLPNGVNTGYSTVAALLTFLNTASVAVTTNGVITSYTGGWAVVGTWTASADNLTLTAEETAGPGTDILAAQIAAINPSL